MIRVTPVSEPPNFDSTVRQPGRAFLKQNPSPSSGDFKPHSYWRASLKDLWNAYRGVCAYTGFYIPRAASHSVDHFKPKVHHPQLAYEWSNFRLALAKVNQYKDNSEGIVDPFRVPYGWFVLDFPSCLVKPGNGLPKTATALVNTTIKVLRLNDDDDLVQERCEIILELVDDRVTMGYLETKYPFIASEVARQGGPAAMRTLFPRKI